MTDDLDPADLVSPVRLGFKLLRLSSRRWKEGPERDLHADAGEPDDLTYVMRRLGDMEERLRALEQEPERVRVLGNYGLEFQREALERRREMLGDAAVALVHSTLTTSELARVERSLRMLDPEDLDSLASLAGIAEVFHQKLTPAEIEAANRAGHPMGEPEYLYQQLMAGHLEGAALVAAGCVSVIPSGRVAYDIGVGLAARVTPIGRLVLRFMGRSQ